MAKAPLTKLMVRLTIKMLWAPASSHDGKFCELLLSLVLPTGSSNGETGQCMADIHWMQTIVVVAECDSDDRGTYVRMRAYRKALLYCPTAAPNSPARHAQAVRQSDRQAAEEAVSKQTRQTAGTVHSGAVRRLQPSAGSAGGPQGAPSHRSVSTPIQTPNHLRV